MPYTLNGIGTWYYGKREVVARMGTCEFCSNYGELKSYNTTLYFVLVFVPLIPLGQKRILNECTSCRKHRVCDLKTFQRERQMAIDGAVDAYRQAPDDVDNLARVLQVLQAYQDRDHFSKIALAASQRLAGNADAQCIAAEGWYYFENFEAAAECWQRALQLRGDDAMRENLARAYCRLGRPDDALPMVAHILTGKVRDRLGLLYFVVEIYQAAGNHASALKVLEGMVLAFPDLPTEKDFIEYRKRSDRLVRSGKPVRSVLTKTATQRPSRAGAFGSWLSRLVGPALLLLLVGSYMFLAWDHGLNAKVHLVNGLQQPYKVEINGQRLTLTPRWATEARVREGIIRIKSLDAAIKPAEQTVELRTPFWSRPFNNQVFVINPDRAAILTHETSVYSQGGMSGNVDSGRPTMMTGRLFYRLPEHDYVFTDFPAQIQMSSSSSFKVKSRLSVYQPVYPANDHALLCTYASPGDRRAFAENLFRADPGSSYSLGMLIAEFGVSNVVDLLRPELDSKPVSINLHRTYQSLAELTTPQENLRAEYRQRLERDPGNNALMYLLGRVTSDHHEAERLFLASEQGTKPIGYGYNAMAYRSSVRGDFVRALDFADKAAGLIPPEHSQRREWLLACRRYDALLAETGSVLRADPGDFGDVSTQVAMLQLLGRTNEIADVIEKFMRDIAPETTPKDQSMFRSALNARLAYLRGDDEAFLRHSGSASPNLSGWLSALVRGDAVAAAKELTVLTNLSPVVHGMVYAMAKKGGNEELASTEFKKLQEGLRSLKSGERAAAAMLEDPSKPTESDLEWLDMSPDDKVFVLLALGWRAPALRETAFKLARTLNYSPDFPHRQLMSLAVTDP